MEPINNIKVEELSAENYKDYFDQAFRLLEDSERKNNIQEGILEGQQDVINLFLGDYDGNSKKWSSKEIVDMIFDLKQKNTFETDEYNDPFIISESIFNEIEYTFPVNEEYKSAMGQFICCEYDKEIELYGEDADIKSLYDFLDKNSIVRINKKSLLLKALMSWYSYNEIDIPVYWMEKTNHYYFCDYYLNPDLIFALLGGKEFTEERKTNLVNNFLSFINNEINYNNIY
ncbi:hypothetical protein [Anaerococcus sp.]|uniref:hypothetical protein n=1 Tax=Anaerococcus sp. TaxID=1872515 RepID=UPI00280C322F|nr:hypothetical protein [Anaerococcus sp.]MDU3176673.1 hypothetical protein [Anaerococcus sp.]